MRTRRMIVVATVVVAALGIAFILWRFKSKDAKQSRPAVQQSANGGPGSKAPPTQAQLVHDMIRHGVTPDHAKLLFSMVVGPLPGVSLPPPEADPPYFDGNLAIEYLNHVWDSLTPEQRDAAAKLIHHEQPKSQSGMRAWPSAHFPSLLPAAFLLGGWKAVDYQDIADTANGQIAGFVNDSPVQFMINVDYGPPPGTEYAHTWSWFRDRNNPNAPDVPYPWGCEITLEDQRMQTLDLLGVQSVLSHEMFHCFQQRVEGSAAARWTLHPWLTEGEATWVMCDMVPGAVIPKIVTMWGLYTSNPLAVYSDRSYDAVGVYGHLSDMTDPGTVWSQLLPMISAGLNGQDQAALTLLLQGNQNDYFTNWGSSYFRVSSQTPWNIAGPGDPPKNSPAPQSVSIAPQEAKLLTPAAPYTGELFQVQGTVDIIGIKLLSGYGRVHDATFSLDSALSTSGPLILCVKQGGCRCPDGTPGVSMYTKQATAPISVGINGGDTTAMLGVGGDMLDDFCQKPDPPPLQPPPPPTGGGDGSGDDGGNDPPKQPPQPPPGQTWGDPHLETFDGFGYNFQVVGEYTLVRSTKDDFIVQVRQVPVLGPKFASINQAMATKLGGKRVTVAFENGHLAVRVDGKIVTDNLPKLKDGAISLADTAYGRVYLLSWPDGTTVEVQQIAEMGINVRVRPAASRKGTLAGLLGDDDGSQDNDLVGMNNKKLGIGPSRDDINHSLADAWRISQSESLFDYAPGQSTKSFLDPNFPASDADSARLTDNADAEKTCRAHGITDQRLLEDCVLDLALTHSLVFGSQYAHQQQVLAARALIAHPSALPAEKMFWVDGEILDSKSQPEFHFDGKKGDVVWVGKDPKCVDRIDEQHHSAFLKLTDPSGKVLEPNGDACEFGRRELPVDGTYTFRGLFGYRDETVRYHVPVRFARHTREQQVAYGQMVTGTIEQRAAWDVYKWIGHEGDVVLISGQGCDVKWMITSILDEAGHDTLGPSCRAGTYYKVPKDGTYRLVVNSDNSPEPGPYQFVFQGGKLALPQ